MARAHLILTLAVAAMIAPEASSARFTGMQLQATLVVLTSCDFASFGDVRYEDVNRAPLGSRVSCNTEIAPVVTYSRGLFAGKSAFSRSEGDSLIRPEIGTRNDITVITMYFF